MQPFNRQTTMAYSNKKHEISFFFLVFFYKKSYGFPAKTFLGLLVKHSPKERGGGLLHFND